MKKISGRVALVAAVVLTAGLGWFAIRQYRCQTPECGVFAAHQVVEQDAHKQLKVGTKKDDVARVYES